MKYAIFDVKTNKPFSSVLYDSWNDMPKEMIGRFAKKEIYIQALKDGETSVLMGYGRVSFEPVQESEKIVPEKSIIKVGETKITKEKGWNYFIDKDGDLSRIPAVNGKDKAEKVTKMGIVKEKGWQYFVDQEGNIAKYSLKKGV